MARNLLKKCGLGNSTLRLCLELGLVLIGLYGIFGNFKPQQVPSAKSSFLAHEVHNNYENGRHESKTHEIAPIGPRKEDSTLGTPEPAYKILLASHSRLLLYDYNADSVSVVHEGLGVYYGVFNGEKDDMGNLMTVWVVTRPLKWREGKEYLTEIALQTGTVQRKVQIDSTFTHDAARFGDRVLVCDTGRGRILELSYPSMAKVRDLPLFTQHDHINSLKPLNDSHLWVVQHNLGKSSAVLVDLRTNQKLESLPAIGTNSHGFSLWNNKYVILDSLNGQLLLIDKATKFPLVIWRANNSGSFLKGLVVMNDLAIFGISPQRQRTARFDTNFDSELVAVYLYSTKELWRRKIPTHGLLNIIYAPSPGIGDLPTSRPLQELHKESVLQDGIGGYWPSGQPFLDLARIRQAPANYSFQLNLTTVNIYPLLDLLSKLDPEVWTNEYQNAHNIFLDDPRHNIAHVKPGVKALLFMFSGNGASFSYWLPNWSLVEGVVLPMLEEILGKNCLKKIARLQIARMPPGSYIKLHKDIGGYAMKCHRIHVPITSPPGVLFESCRGYGGICEPIALRPGHVFEINNEMYHRVSHSGQEDRIHMVVDVSENELDHLELKAGTKCHYDSGDLSCHS